MSLISSSVNFLLVAPVAGAEDAVEGVGVDPLDLLHGVLEGGADVLGGGADVVPVAAVGDLEAVLVLEILAVLLDHPGVLFIPDIADPLEEEQRQDVALPVGPIDRRAAQDVGGFPEVGLDVSVLTHKATFISIAAHESLLPSRASTTTHRDGKSKKIPAHWPDVAHKISILTSRGWCPQEDL